MNNLSISNVSPLVKGLCIVIVMGLFTACQNNVGPDTKAHDITPMDIPSPLAMQHISTNDILEPWKFATKAPMNQFFYSYEESSDGFTASYLREFDYGKRYRGYVVSGFFRTMVKKNGKVKFSIEFTNNHNPEFGAVWLRYYHSGKLMSILKQSSDSLYFGEVTLDLKAGEELFFYMGSRLKYPGKVPYKNASIDGNLTITVGNDPENKQDCMKGGWEDFGFKNQGQCIRFVQTGKDSR